MHYRPLSTTDLRVSELCLGTMTFGEQNSEADAFAQLDLAVASGINFIDAAEMYPVPPRPETQGLTETYIGNWMASRNNRADLILATKVSGPSDSLEYLRGPQLRLNRANIETALDNSLRRLQTDYLDLYQLHWPDRNTNYFGKLGYEHSEPDHSVPLAETLGVLNDLVQAGKIRYIGLSNETPWGTMHALALAEQHGLPRAVTIQNPYNLLNRVFEIGLAEIAIREQCGLLAYSPLAFGQLTGKYRHGARPENARLTLFTRFDRYSNPQAIAATENYLAIAERHHLNPTQMALAWVTSRPFVTSTIIGATSLAQLRTNLASGDLQLSPELIAEIEDAHRLQPNPSP
ncbi:MAG TPA: NADP(H)-dependent aldo-keto reductase [Chromatiaceae bacterium]|jgi:aryl-alcohol dehydrogenase-like predicted oxidoreductase|nr:MAG: hypothetical protein N838_02345 [Thiohalocapsa sp. PB-PSB1]QQO56741.1 MAG: NADP(H)-dependent aldo-keto reductase [Thiohalocapsa sp. PB-PSB1]HBG94136.1 NADP(H)-dependent aldo-keto reductase [Chromatiaceae bacterium]